MLVMKEECTDAVEDLLFKSTHFVSISHFPSIIGFKFSISTQGGHRIESGSGGNPPGSRGTVSRKYSGYEPR